MSFERIEFSKEKAGGRYIFIVGCARTGTRMLRSILMAHPEVNLLDELHYLVPWWIRKDFCRQASAVGPLIRDENVRKLVELMYSNNLEGNFWKTNMRRNPNKVQSRITDLDRKRLEQLILNSDRSFRSILVILLDEHTVVSGKQIPGAKNPFNISYSSKLTDWFPDCRVIHIVRDPRAIYTSMIQFTKENAGADQYRWKTAFRFSRLAHIVQQYRSASSVHTRSVMQDNYHLLRYEDVVEGPERQIKALCDFLDIEFFPDMLYPEMSGRSAYGRKPKDSHGFDPQIVDRWRSRIPALDRIIIEASLSRQMRMFGYSFSSNGE